MKVAISGASGFVGQYIVRAALAAGWSVTSLGRTAPAFPGIAHIPWSLGDIPDLAGQDAVIHAAFRHAPGHYRGGEGDDPEGFAQANLQGSIRLFGAAKRAGVSACLFLSSRAVFDGYPPGTSLTEDLSPVPTTLYGQVKAEAENGLSTLSSSGFRTASIRPTGIYGIPQDGSPHKWTKLFADFHAGTAIAPQVATEVHAADAANAILTGTGKLLAEARGLSAGRAHQNIHISDLVLDRHDLLTRYAAILGIKPDNIPPPMPTTGLRILDCRMLLANGWKPAGHAALDATLREIAR